jgi:hypothetical protein
MRFAALILTVGLTLTFTISFAQEKTKLVNEIRKQVNVIDSDTTQKKVVLNNEEFLEHAADGGGQLAGFYKAGQLRKIVRSVGLSNGNEIVDFYFKDNKLIFVHDQFNSFVYDPDKQTFRFDTTEKTFDGHYYFYNNKLIDQISTGHNRFEDDNIDAEKIWLTEANDNKKLLERNKKKSR